MGNPRSSRVRPHACFSLPSFSLVIDLRFTAQHPPPSVLSFPIHRQVAIPPAGRLSSFYFQLLLSSVSSSPRFRVLQVKAFSL
ncbi:unnamed protein product [Citrullus colocynthis]|uniref:Uncharacterized protein n=1 Tax=Citrullus colocynthis TaxID=252529 RepID=A0ABP0Z6F8_9ROSI